jgi:hypothetical protein
MNHSQPSSTCNAVFESRKPLFEPGRGIAAEYALAEHSLANAFDALLEVFVIPGATEFP